MTKVPQGFDVSFLNDEEARKILRVLERNEELQRAEKERISKLQKTKRDVRWLQGVTGEWFEEIQRKRFCKETDISQMLKPPLTYRLTRRMAKNDSVDLQTSRSKNLLNPKNPISFPSQRSFRSSFASLFSFRKSQKESLKLPTLGQRGRDGLAGPPVSMRGAVGATIYSSPLDNQPVDNTFVPRPAGMREGSALPPWEASLLENEFFRVLDDLDSKLAQEQFPSSLNTSTPFNYESTTQLTHLYSRGSRPGNITGRHKNRYNETSKMSIYDILRPGAPREGFKTFSPRTKTIYDMYRTREPRVLKEDYVQKNTLGSSSLCFDSRQRSASPATGHFTARSLHFPATIENKSGFIPQSHIQSPKRIPLSSIIWNRSDSSRDGQNQEEFQRAPLPMEIDPADQYTYPRCFQENRRYAFYRSQSAYQSVSLNAPMDNAISPDPFENSENMPFYHQDNPFARSFFSNTFGQRREQIFGHSTFWGQQEDHSSWSDFYQSRKSFTSSERDFEMISIDASSASAAHGCSVPSQHGGSFAPGCRPNISRDQEEPRPWQFDFQASTLENMEVSQGRENQLTPQFSTPNVCPMIDSSCQIKSGRLECQQDNSREVHLNREAYLFGIAQPSASPFKTSFPQIPGGKGNPHSSSFQNPTATSHEIIPNKPACSPIRSHAEVTVTNSDSVDSLPSAESQPSILVTEENQEKDLNDSVSKKYKQLNKMDQTDLTTETSQPVLQTVVSCPLPDVQNPLSRDSSENNQFVFNASTTINSKRSPRVLPRKDISKIYISHRDKANELKKEESFSRNRKLSSATSPSFLPECRITPFLPSPNQGCHQELTVSNEGISIISKNNLCSTESTDNQNPQSPEKSIPLDHKREKCTMTHSINCSKFAGSHNVSGTLLSLPLGALQDSSILNSSTTVFSKRSLSGNDLPLGEREENHSASKNQNNPLAINHLESQKHNDNCVPIYNKVVDVTKCHSHHPLRDGNGKIRRRISCIENLSKPESRSTFTNDGSNLNEVNQGNSKAPDRPTIYCTLPRKASSFLLNSRNSESKVTTASLRNGPLPFQVKNNGEDPVKKYTSQKLIPSSPESESEGSKVVSDSAPVVPAATQRMTNLKIIGSASVRKGPLPFLIKRAVSCPSGEPYSSTGNDERAKDSASDIYTSAVSPKPWERFMNNLESDSSIRNKNHHQKEYSQECTEKDDKTAAPRAGLVSLSNEDPLPFSSEVSEKESGKTIRKYKTTSTFSVSGDDDNVKCLEVVSIYYTIPRKDSKKICDLLYKYTQSTNSLPKSPKVGTETFPNASQNGKQNYSTQEQSGTSSDDQKMPISSAHENIPCLSYINENVTALQLPNSGSSEPTLQEMASIEADVSLPKEVSKTRDTFPDNFTKAPLGDSRSRKKKGKKLQREKLENCQQAIKSGNSSPSSPRAHSEDNVEKSQTVRSSEENVDDSIVITSTRSNDFPKEEIRNAVAINANSSGLEAREVSREIETGCQQKPDKTLCDSENQILAVTLALHKLQFDEETFSGKPNVGSLQSELKEIPQRSQEVNITEIRKTKDGMQRLAWDQPSLPEGSNENKASLDGLRKGKNRSSTKHKVANISKASRKFPAKDLSPRRHVATIFTTNESRSSTGGFNSDIPESNPLCPEHTPRSAESTDGSRNLNNDGVDMEKCETPLQVTVISNRKPSTHLSNHKSNISILQPHWNEFNNTSESPPKNENSMDVTVTPTLERESAILVQPTFIPLREEEFSDHQRRFSPPCPLEAAHNSPTECIPLANCPQQQRNASSLGWKPEPHLYRSKSLRSINVHSDKLRNSHPPKVRERHFSESTSIDDALSQLSLGNDFSINNGYSRKFKSFSELPCDENESWTKIRPKSATSISRPIDYGIFGKEQQLAFLENVKRSLTQGRLWKPSFLKNPGFLKDDIINPPNPSETLSSNSPSSQMPEDGLSPTAPLNIYEEDPVDSDWDTDTTTDDEYYLDENDKESEL